MKTLSDVLNKAQTQANKTIALACPEEREVLAAVFEARRFNICNFIFYGDHQQIINITSEIGEKLDDGITIVDVKDKTLASELAVKAISSGKADVLMKGLVDTKIILKEVLNNQYGLRTEYLLSHIMVCQLPKFDRLLFLSDGGMVINPDPQQLVEITINAIGLAQSLGISKPKVALLSAVEKVNPKMPSTEKCKYVSDFFENNSYRADVCGPLAVDLALDLESAKIKQINHIVAGNADILIAPFIEVANALYKGWMFGCDNTKSAGIIMGAKAPIIITSRADNQQSKLYSIALSVIMK